jgi:parallel beta-helix repeat protein
MRLLAAAALSTLALAATPARAAQSFGTCAGFIDTLPAVLSTQGVWCLRRDLSTAITSGDAITVAANNITIDCNDYKLGGLAGGPDTKAVGIRASQRLNTTVRNCNVRGFQMGIFLHQQGAGHVVENNRLEANTRMGIVVFGSNTIIRGNFVLDSGASTTESTTVIPIHAGGEGLSVIDNDVAGVQAQSTYSSTYAIYVTGRAVVARNRVSGMPDDTLAADFGIYSHTGAAAIHDNVVHGPTNPLGTVGIRCADSLSVAKGNILLGLEDRVTGCTLSGNVAPIN